MLMLRTCKAGSVEEKTDTEMAKLTPAELTRRTTALELMIAAYAVETEWPWLATSPASFRSSNPNIAANINRSVVGLNQDQQRPLM